MIMDMPCILLVNDRASQLSCASCGPYLFIVRSNDSQTGRKRSRCCACWSRLCGLHYVIWEAGYMALMFSNLRNLLRHIGMHRSIIHMLILGSLKRHIIFQPSCSHLLLFVVRHLTRGTNSDNAMQHRVCRIHRSKNAAMTLVSRKDRRVNANNAMQRPRVPHK